MSADMHSLVAEARRARLRSIDCYIDVRLNRVVYGRHDANKMGPGWTVYAPPECTDVAELLGKLFLDGSASDSRIAMRAGECKTERRGLTPSDLAAHVAGKTRFGAIPFVDDERVRWGCIDLDVRLWGLEPDDPEVFAIINAIVETLAGYEIRAALERSKSKGWHVWTFFDAPVLAADLRALLRRVAIEAGARDESDLVCPRQDRRTDVGNGTWLPLFGGDVAPHTRFYVFDPVAAEWVESDDQAYFLRWLLAPLSSAADVPPAQTNGAGSSANPQPDPPSHPCTWILDELREHGVELLGVVFGTDKIQFACPIHIAEKTRTQGGSAVMWSDGHGHCSSAKCDRKWRTLAELLRMLGVDRDREGPRSILTPIKSIERREVEWLWEGRIPRGKITILDGDPGLGKSTVTLDLAARISRGREMPDDSPGISGSVVLCSYEDDAGDTIRPRLEAAGADLARIHILTVNAGDEGERLLELPADLAILEAAVAKVDAALLVVDPLMAALSGGVDSHRDQDVRRVLSPLSKLAERTGVAVVLVRHLNKGGGSGTSAIYRGGGSIGIAGAARSALLVAKDPEDPDRRVIASVKSNLAAPAEALGFRTIANDLGIAIEWLGVSACSADELLAMPIGSEERSAFDEAKDFLRDYLDISPRPASDVWKASKAHHIAEQTLKRAKAALGVKAIKTGFAKGGEWYWSLPPVDAVDPDSALRGPNIAKGTNFPTPRNVVPLGTDGPLSSDTHEGDHVVPLAATELQRDQDAEVDPWVL